MGVIGFITGSAIKAIAAGSVFSTQYITGTLIPYCVAHPVIGIPVGLGTLVAGGIMTMI